MLVLICYNRS